MTGRHSRWLLLTAGSLSVGLLAALAQQPPPPPPGGFGPGGGFGRGGFGPGPGMQERELVQEYDKDGDKRLDAKERAAARAALAAEPRRGFRPFRGGREENGPPTPGPKLTPKQVKNYQDEPFYDTSVLRTIFLEFENTDWEKELEDFHNSDVEVPAKATVDGKAYPDVGVHFRGMSSYMMVGAGQKRSLNLSFDFVHKDQRIGGYRTLNLLNSHNDATFVRTVLYMQAARSYIPAPKANFVRVVINGESWGIYISAQQFNGDFLKENYSSTKGARWKVPGSPMGRGGLQYLGEDAAAYKRIYEIKTKDDSKSWAALIRVTKVLTETPLDRLEAELDPIFDVDGALKFLALEKVLINSDGYWSRASDYNLYLDEKGKLHVIPHDGNEAFGPPEMMGGGGPRGGGGRGGPGGPPPGFPPGGPPPGFGPGGPPAGGPPPGGFGGPGRGGARDAKLDLFAGSDDANKVLLSRMLAVPSLRKRYLAYAKDVAEKWLDWGKIEPLARKYQALIAADVKADTRKLDSTENFIKGITEETSGHGFGPFGGRPVMSLKQFVEERRAFVLNQPGIQGLQ